MVNKREDFYGDPTNFSKNVSFIEEICDIMGVKRNKLIIFLRTKAFIRNQSSLGFRYKGTFFKISMN